MGRRLAPIDGSGARTASRPASSRRASVPLPSRSCHPTTRSVPLSEVLLAAGPHRPTERRGTIEASPPSTDRHENGSEADLAIVVAHGHRDGEGAGPVEAVPQ